MRILTLVTIAGGCGIGVGAMAVLLTKEQNKYAGKASFVHKAVELAQSQETVRNLLGDSIEAQRARIERNWGNGPVSRNHIKILVPLKGQKDTAQMFVYARRRDETCKLGLWKLEITFDKLAGKRLVLLDLPGDETLPNDDILEPPKQADSSEKHQVPQRTGPPPKGLEQKREMEKNKVKQCG